MKINWGSAGGLAALVFGGGVACSPVALNCTDIGCTTGLRVAIQGTPAESFTITATAPESEPQVIECSPANPCRLLFPDYTPAQVTITYESATTTVEQMFEVGYERQRPNGPDCPPECLTATVTIKLEP
jgi:hypothetical protein